MAITSAVAATLSAGTAVYLAATQSSPKTPAPQQAAKAAQAPLYNRSRQGGGTPQSMLGALLAGNGSTGGVATLGGTGNDTLGQ